MNLSTLDFEEVAKKVVFDGRFCHGTICKAYPNFTNEYTEIGEVLEGLGYKYDPAYFYGQERHKPGQEQPTPLLSSIIRLDCLP